MRGRAEKTNGKETMMESEPQEDGKSWRSRLIGTPLGWALSLAIAALGVYLLVAHTGHLFAALPYLLLVACPLLHVFKHGGHKHRHPDSK